MIKIYNNTNPCSKCGAANNQISTRFVSVGARISLSGAMDIANRDLMHRYCRNCGFEWNELPLDSQAGVATAKESIFEKARIKTGFETVLDFAIDEREKELRENG